MTSMDCVKMNETVNNNSPGEQISHSVALCCQQWLLPLYRMQLIKSTDNFTEQQTHYISVKGVSGFFYIYFSVCSWAKLCCGKEKTRRHRNTESEHENARSALQRWQTSRYVSLGLFLSSYSSEAVSTTGRFYPHTIYYWAGAP